jgi:hypothetical protein
MSDWADGTDPKFQQMIDEDRDRYLDKWKRVE